MVRAHSSIHGFLRLAGSTSVMALALASLPGAAWAQDASATSETTQAAEAETEAGQDTTDAQTEAVESGATTDEIVVTGIRASLSRAQDRKRNSDTVIDSITAEDIGALPDRSVNEALQRVPGVAITRFASADNTQHFSIEGSGVVVRGLPWVKGEFNGRDTFSPNGGREIGYDTIASELVGSVDVYKNLTADLIEGGISGTVSINTRKPFDTKERLLFLSGELTYGDFIKKAAPTITGLYSQQWELANGSRIGLLASGTYSKLHQRTQSTYLASPFQRFTGTRTFNAGSPYQSTVTDTFPVPAGFESVYAPQGAGVRNMDFERTRIGLSAAAQYATADNKLVATASFLRADGRTVWEEHTIEPNVWYGEVNATFPAAGTDYQFDEDGLFVSGNITRPGGPHEGWRGDGTYGVLGNFMNGGMFTTLSNRGNITDAVTDDYSLNLKWNPTDRLRFNFDAQHVKGRAEGIDVIIDTATWSNMSLDLSGDFPQVGFSIGQLPDGSTPSTADYFRNPNSIYVRDAFTNRIDNDGAEWALRADAEYDLSDTGFLRRVRAGVRYSDRDQVVRENGYNNWGAPSETWTGGGPVTFASIDQSQWELYSFPNFFRGDHPAPPVAPFFAGNVAEEYDRFQDVLRDVTVLGQGNYTPLEDRACATVREYFCPSEVYRNSEETHAAYLRLDFAQDLGGEAVIDGNVGIRYVTTRDVAKGFLNLPQPTTIFTPSDEYPTLTAYCEFPRTDPSTIPPICRMSPAEQQSVLAFANGAAYDFDATNKYDNWLPSLNVRFRPSRELQFRLAASKAISRPNFGQLRSYLNIGTGSAAGGGVFFQSSTPANPYLTPIKATQVDLTAEWYFSRVGQLTGTLFWKRLSDIIDPNSQSVFDLSNNGETFPIVLNGPANIDGKASIKGLEVSYQQTLDFLPGILSAVGVQGTYTYVDPGKFPNPTAANAPGDGSRPPGEVDALYGSLPFPGLSKHNYNLSAFYDRSGLYARLAYSWRSRYLATVRDCCFPFLPTYAEASGQLDGSLFYNINKNVKLGLQGTNLLNEITRVSMGVGLDGEGDVLRIRQRAFVTDRRITAVARLTF